MRDIVLGFAVIIGIAAAAIMIVPAIERYGRFRRRRGLMRAFLHAADDGQIRATFRRQKEVFGDGFIDTFAGTAGTLRFRLSRRFRPFKDVDAYHLELGHGDADGDGRETFHLEIGTPEKGGHPVAACYRALRNRRPMGTPKSEAS